MPPKPWGVQLRVFLDEGVPDGVGHVFETRGHLVRYGNRELLRGTADPIVCMSAQAKGSILVAADGDMKALARAAGVSNSRFRTLSLIKISCRKTQAAQKVGDALSVIEHEWVCREESGRKRLFVEVSAGIIRIVRE